MLSFINQFILKVQGTCNLACDHCYVYEHADQSWRQKPQSMTVNVAIQAATRIGDYARIHGLPVVRIVLHGGEPLLLGVTRLRAIIATLVREVSRDSSLSLHVQTNGVLLNEQFCRLFDEYDVKVGISLDGDKSSNDRHRRYANGRSSHPQALRALALLRRPEFRHLYGGILCTVDISNDPMDVYEALLKENPPHLDFLLPHATWVQPPPGHDADTAPYGNWLRKVHLRWLSEGRPVPIRLFDALTAASRGLPSGSEAIGLHPVALAVVDTDGSWEQADSLKTAYDGAPATGMNVSTHSVMQVTAHPGMVTRNEGYSELCGTCRACPVVHICGGGLYAHRFGGRNGFDNPSVYCADLNLMARHVASTRSSVTYKSPQEKRIPEMHRLPEGAFDAFAAGPGTVEGIAALQNTQLSITRALIAGGAEPTGQSDLAQAARFGRQLLIDLDRNHPAATREVFNYPFVQAWALRCLTENDDSNQKHDAAHIAGLAAAAAWRAGVTTRLRIPVRAGLIHLPGLGASRVSDHGTTAVLSLQGAEQPPPEWISLREVATPLLSVVVDDLNPYRVANEWTARGRLSASDWESCRVSLATAADEIKQLLPLYAPVLKCGLRTIVPLQRGNKSSEADRSIKSNRTFAEIGVQMTVGSSLVDVAEALLRGFQHMKLRALMDMYDFFTVAANSTARIQNDHPGVQVEEALHDLYTHVSLAELWRARSLTTPSSLAERRAEAIFRFHLRRADRLADTLSEAGVLAPAGARFTHGLRTTVDRLRDL
ncbi:FxsB family cyclophane-forming radical SAM/SPASM peptide maturase [Streptomyces albogriseolus]|uniref:FxsB family cyclophane-forming radical SAM/SPASM peptide maturase n=1 Tax=Streptomyces albogriseolus TaxID=1887 RepID=UPI00346075F2